jgi:hypothetical protein
MGFIGAPGGIPAGQARERIGVERIGQPFVFADVAGFRQRLRAGGAMALMVEAPYGIDRGRFAEWVRFMKPRKLM